MNTGLDKLRWGIIGTGTIARTFAKGLAGSATGRLVAVASRDLAKAQAFAQEHGVGRPYGSYEALLADDEIHAVYISTPHPEHAQWAIKAARAKKHILCEKPIGLNHAEAMAIVQAARDNGVFLMEAFMYRCHPQTAKLVELIRAKAVGDVKMIVASFGFTIPFNVESRLLKNELAGGGILDVGCYPVSMSRLIAGAALGKDFADPIDVKAAGHLGQTGVDEYAAATLRFEGDIVAQVSTGVQLELENAVRVYGTEGHILLRDPWIPAREGGKVTIEVHRRGKSPEMIDIATAQHLYGIEADVVARDLARREAASPAMTLADTLGNMKTLDAWRAAIGLEYEMEKPGNVPTILRTPLRVHGNAMTSGQVPGIAKKISRLVMGVDNITFAPHCAVLWDDFTEHGGNAFDTAHIYGGGACERALGAWVKSRGVRDQVVILDKGAHTPWCTPDWLTRQHRESLERLGMDHVDLYMMHRDNVDVPVGEFADVLHAHVSAGTMRAIGVSNWSLERIEAFNDYAKKHGKTPLAAVSNNFSLARMVEAPWSGCISSNRPPWRAWHEETQTPLFAWSSQARGFFVEGNASPDKRDDAELVRCWYSDDNFARLARAKELASTKGVKPINIALAYVLAQTWPTFALVGPRTLVEWRDALVGLAVQLTPAEVESLDHNR